MSDTVTDLAVLARTIKEWGRELGFAEVRIADVDLSHMEAPLQAWLDAGYHGEMDYMASHGMKRARPAELVPGTVRAISARMNYLPPALGPDWRARWRRVWRSTCTATWAPARRRSRARCCMPPAMRAT